MYERRNNATLTVAAGTTTYAGVSRDGGEVFYVQSGNIFAFDANSLTTTSITSGGGATVVNISADGSHVYFASTQQLDGSKGTLGAENFYVWDGASVRFIVVLDPSDFTGFGGSNLINLGTWTTAVGPVQTSGSGPEVDPSRTNPDGTVLAFQSHASLTSYDSGGHSEVYRFDDEEPDQAKQLTCVSCSPIGAVAASEAELAPNISDESRKTNMLAHTENVSDDGQTVFFQSGDPLVPGDVNGTTDVYEWKEGRVSLISSGRSTTPSRVYGMTPDGHDVFFTTDEALVPEDHTGSAGAIYDARVDGGFSRAVVRPPCVEDACQGSPSAPPSLLGAASGSFQGPGNLQPHRKKRHHKKHHKRHHHKARHNSGGAK
jgi:hypothetical protein